MKSYQKKAAGFWANLELKWRITLVIVLLFAFATSTQILRFWFFIEDEQVLYLIENRNLQTETAASSLSVAILSLGQSIAADPANSYQGTPKLSDAERMPEGSEVFVQSEPSKRKTLIARSAAGDIRAKSIDIVWLLRQIPVVAEIKGILMTESAIPVAYFGLPGLSDKNAAIERFKNILNEKTNRGETVRKRVFLDDIVMGHQLVEGTNLLLYTEANLSKLHAPAYAKIRAEAVTSLGVLVLLLFVVGILFKALTAPVQQLVDVFEMIGSGVRNPKWPDLLPEFKPIRNAIDRMNSSISERQREIELISSALQDILRIAQVSSSSAPTQMLSLLSLPLNQFFVNYFPRLCAKEPIQILMKTFYGNEFQKKGIQLSSSKGISPMGLLQLEELAQRLEVFEPVTNTNFFTDASHQNFFARLGKRGWRMEMFIFFQDNFKHLTALEMRILELLSNTINKLFEGVYLDQVHLEVSISNAELASARDIQRSSLVEPPFDLHNSVCIQSVYEPCEQVGGDWYGVFNHTKLNLVNVYIGDVSGHGLASAFLANLVSGAIQSEEMSMKNSSEKLNVGQRFGTLAAQLNALVASGSGGKKNMTMCMASLNVETGRLTLLSAGQPFAMRFSKATQRIDPLVVHQNDLLGSGEGQTYQASDVLLKPGDLVLLYTDGLTESLEKHPGQSLNQIPIRTLGSKKLIKLMHSIGYSQVLAKRISEEVKKNRSVDDDLALVSLIWKGPP